jgi:hypothetical protein
LFEGLATRNLRQYVAANKYKLQFDMLLRRVLSRKAGQQDGQR